MRAVGSEGEAGSRAHAAPARKEPPLDITIDEKGNAQATAGSYIDEKAYVGVKQGMPGNTRIFIDHKLIRNLKARGEVGANDDGKPASAPSGTTELAQGPAGMRRRVSMHAPLRNR